MAAGEHKISTSFPLINFSICFCLVHSALYSLYLCASMPLCPSWNFFFFLGRWGKGWVSMDIISSGAGLVALVPIPSNSMDLISPVKFGFLTPHYTSPNLYHTSALPVNSRIWRYVTGVCSTLPGSCMERALSTPSHPYHVTTITGAMP